MKTVLFVDDDPVVLQIISLSMQLLAVPVICVNSAQEALQVLAAREDIGLVVSDIEMPGMNGIELHAHMKHDERLKIVPFALMTGGSHRTAPDHVRILRKPFTHAEVCSLVSSHLEAR